MAKRAPPSYGVKFKWNSEMDRFIAYLATLEGKLGSTSERAMKKATLMALTEITERIRAGKYKKLAPLTATLKSMEGYSQTPLIRTGALMRAITRDVIGPYTGVVGINKNAKGKRGRDPVTGRFTAAEISNIALTLHEGARIKITDKMKRGFMRRMKMAAKKAGGASLLRRRGSSKGIMRIPPRPFIKAVFEDAAFVARIEDLFWTELYKEVGIGR